jgi:hypothetical protein
MFDRFTSRARQAAFYARSQVSRLGSSAIEPEHIALGVLDVGKGMACQILARTGESLDRFRSDILGRLRVRSFRQAPKCAREAADQLLANGLPGFVAVNVDVLLKLHPELPGPEATLAERLDIVEEIEAAMAEREHVLGTITLGRDATWDFSDEKPTVSVSHSLRFTSHPRTAQAEAEARTFFERMNTMIDRRMETL